MQDYDIAWLVREVFKITDMPLWKIAEAIDDELFENEDLSEDEKRVANDIVGDFQSLWAREGWRIGPDAQIGLLLIQKALRRYEWNTRTREHRKGE